MPVRKRTWRCKWRYCWFLSWHPRHWGVLMFGEFVGFEIAMSLEQCILIYNNYLDSFLHRATSRNVGLAISIPTMLQLFIIVVTHYLHPKDHSLLLRKWVVKVHTKTIIVFRPCAIRALHWAPLFSLETFYPHFHFNTTSPTCISLIALKASSSNAKRYLIPSDVAYDRHNLSR